jgi:hypothetical protein
MWYVILLGFGIYLLRKGLTEFRGCISFLKGSKISHGKAVELKTVFDRRGNQTYQPIFQFKAKQNEEILFQSPISRNPSPYKLGEEVLIAFNEANPSDAKIFTYFGIFGKSILMFAVALPSTIIGAGYFVFLILT